MKILVENGTYGCHNAGDMTMLQVCVNRLHEYFPTAKIYVVTQSPENLTKNIPNCIPIELLEGKLLYSQNRNLFKGLHKLIPLPNNKIDDFEEIFKNRHPKISHYLISKFTKDLSKKLKIDNYFTFLDTIDFAIVSGGGFLTDDFATHSLKLLDTINYIISNKKPVAFFGQGIGPIANKKLKFISSNVLTKASLITLREALVGPKLLEDLGVKKNHFKITGDDAISYAANGRARDIGECIGFNIRFASYAGVSKNTAENVFSIIKIFSDYKKSKIIPLPVSWHKKENDLDNILDIMSQHRDENSSKLETSEGLSFQISLCRIVVTGSYHSGVFALSQGIPVICLASSQYYVDKFNGLSDMFLSGVNVVCLSDENWREQFSNALDYMWKNAEILRIDLIKQADKQIKLSKEAYDYFFNKIINNK